MAVGPQGGSAKAPTSAPRTSGYPVDTEGSVPKTWTAQGKQPGGTKGNGNTPR